MNEIKTPKTKQWDNNRKRNTSAIILQGWEICWLSDGIHNEVSYYV